MPTTVKDIQNLEKLNRELKKIREVKSVELLPNCQKDVDIHIKIVVSHPKTWELIERISETISNVKWQIFKESGELPAIEWEIVEENV